ncbi:MAG: response regulator, partial [Nodosilinea sp.]
MSTVLIVDDDPTMQLALTRRLQDRGFEVVNASSAKEALELLTTKNADVVVSDVMMPGMSGFEFCRLLRSRPEGETVPF